MLLVEDNPGDVRLAQEAFVKLDETIQISVATDGCEAMDYLHHRGKFTQSIRPDLILLDLKLPKMDGREVLEHIKNDNELKAIPIVILTTSDMEAELVKSYDLKPNCYFKKPIQWDAYGELVKKILQCWRVSQHFVSCPCGAELKVQLQNLEDFPAPDQTLIDCPKCGVRHSVPRPALRLFYRDSGNDWHTAAIKVSSHA